jgi:hypothetical protein
LILVKSSKKKSKSEDGEISESNQQLFPDEVEEMHLHEKEIPRKVYSPKTEKQSSVDRPPFIRSKMMTKLSLGARIDGSKKQVPKSSQEHPFTSPTTQPMESQTALPSADMTPRKGGSASMKSNLLLSYNKLLKQKHLPQLSRRSPILLPLIYLLILMLRTLRKP